MQKLLFAVIFLLFNRFLIQGQNTSSTNTKGEVVIDFKKPRRLDTIPDLLSDTFYFESKTFKIILSKNYKASLYPRVAHDQLLLTDKNGKVQNLSILYYEFDCTLRGSNALEGRYTYLLPNLTSVLKVNQSLDIGNVKAIDLNGEVKRNFIQPFTIKRIR